MSKKRLPQIYKNVARVVFAAFLLMFLFVHQMSAAPADEFVTTWKTDNAGTSNSTSISIPLAPSTAYNFGIDWNNDGVVDQTYNAITPATPLQYVTHDYGTAGTYKVRISGTFPAIYFFGGGDKAKILEVNQWGTIAWKSMLDAFNGCANLHITATDAPNLSGVQYGWHVPQCNVYERINQPLECINYHLYVLYV